MAEDRIFGFQTRAVHVGQGVDAESGAIRRPITMANSYAFPDDPSILEEFDLSGTGVNVYTRNGGANQKHLQEKVASLHGGEDCVVLASGVAALHGLFFSLLKHGDHIVVSDTTYIAVYLLLHKLLPERYGVETTMVDSSDPENVRAAIRPNTKLIHIEPVANPTTKITDVAAVAKIAQEAGILLSVDNTFSSPYNQRPLEQGADLVIESLTKYINGHGDSLGGAIVGPTALLADIRENSQINVGGVISPFNAWLITRGAATLPLRVRQINETALTVARWLEGFPGTRFVWYPGLESTPNHDVAARQMKGFGGMMAFDFTMSMTAHLAILKQFKVITAAASLGHDESLIIPWPPEERAPLFPEPHRPGFFRFSIGLEDADDIIWDLEQAYEAVKDIPDPEQ